MTPLTAAPPPPLFLSPAPDNWKLAVTLGLVVSILSMLALPAAAAFWITGAMVALVAAAFVVNALDNLSGSNDLISLRSRGEFSRPFEKVKEIQRDAEKRFLDKEKAVREKLKDTERKIQALQSQKQSGNAVLLSNEQRQEMENFRMEQLKTRKELRNVQHELRKNIEALGRQLKFINIGLVPLIVMLFAAGIGIYRSRRSAT